MTYELVLAVMPPDRPDPVEYVERLMDPFLHTEECHHIWQENEDPYKEEPVRPGHFWDSADVGGRYFSGCLWRDRNGLRLPDHPINGPEDEVRLVCDVDLRFLYLSPTSLVTPDGDIYFMMGCRTGRWPPTIALFMAYEDRLAAYPDHLAVPLSCHK